MPIREERTETMNKKNTYIFDLDGTLLDTLDDLYHSLNYALDKMNYPLRRKEEVRQFVGNGILMLIKRAVPEGTSDEKIMETQAVFKEHYGIHCNDQTGPYPGIDDLIDQLLEKNIKMAIVSNKADFAVKELAEIYFNGRIPVAIGEKESEGIRKKPAPDTVFEALRLLDASVEDAVYVGDSEVDIETAKNCGMDVILCSWGFRSVDQLIASGARLIIDEPAEMLSYAV